MPGPEGSLSDCWWCDKPFLLTPLNMESNKPICDECTEKKRIADSIANEIPDYTPIGRDAFKSSEQRMFELGKRNVEAEEARKKAETEKKVEETDQIEVDEPSEENE